MVSSKMGNLTGHDWAIVVSGVRTTTSNPSSMLCGRSYVLTRRENAGLEESLKECYSVHASCC